MNEELKEALELIKNECKKHFACYDCPLNLEDSIYRCILNDLPTDWKID